MATGMVATVSPRTLPSAPQGCIRTEPVSSPLWTLLLRQLKSQLHLLGFDIAEPLAISWYNDSVPEGVGRSIPIPSAPGGRTLALLVGNNKNLWPHFLKAYNSDPSLQHSEDPLDTYVERCISAATNATGRPARIFWGHQERDGVIGGPSLELQRMASAAGVAFWDESSCLSLHLKYGPWFALRAVVVFDGIEYTGSRPPALQNPLNDSTKAYVRMAVRSARNPSSDNLADMSGKKDLGERRSSGDEHPTREVVRSRWQRWVAVRDAPYPGHIFRYPKLMLEYHYTGNRACLQPNKC
ncbi:probable methylmalonic aciduria and homocystinuria type C protein [Coccomyxa sp. Obi]|nr:probable methylmalonic aciduria and homocystinuria type C protein [Coccomyxa sp. Obi]